MDKVTCVLAVIITLCFGLLSPTAVAAQDAALVVGRSVEQPVESETTRTYTFSLAADEVMWVRLREHRADAKLIFQDAAGKTLREVDTEQGFGFEQATFVAPTAGSYRLAVAVKPLVPTGGNFTLEAERKPLNDQERERSAAEIEDLDGYHAILKGDAQTAVSKWQNALKRFTAIGDLHGQAEASDLLGYLLSMVGQRDQSLALRRAAAEMCRKAADARCEAVAYHNIGSLMTARGDKAAALEAYTHALGLAQTSASEDIEADCLYSIAEADISFGDFRNATDYFKRAGQLGIEIGDKRSQGLSKSGLAEIYYEQARYHESIDAARDAAQLLASSGQARDAIGAMAMVSRAYRGLGDFTSAMAAAQQSLQVARAVKDKQSECLALTDLADSALGLGDIEKALESATSALKIAKDTKLKGFEQSSLQQLAQINIMLGENELAAQYAASAIEVSKEMGDEGRTALSFGARGHALFALGDTVGAEEAYLESRSRFKAGSVVTSADIPLSGLIDVYISQGKFDAARDVIDEGLAYARTTGNLRAETTFEDGLGLYFDKIDQDQNSIEHFKRVVLLAEEVGDQLLLSKAFGRLSEANDNLDREPLSVLYGKIAVSESQAVRSRLLSLDSATQKSFLHTIETSYRRLAASLIESNRLAEAVEVLNALKDQSSFDFENSAAMELTFSPEEQSAADKIRSAGKRLGSAKLAIDTFNRELGNSKHTAEDDARIGQLNSEVADAAANFTETLRQVEEQLPATAAVPKTPGLKNVQEAIQREEGASKQRIAAIYTLAVGHKYYAVIVSPNNVSAVNVSFDEDRLNATAKRLWELMKSPGYDPRPASKEIYDVIFAPVKKKLTPDTKTLIWSLDENLRYLPIAALYDGKRYLVERYNNVVFTRIDGERLTHARPKSLDGVGMGSSEAHELELAGVKFKAAALPSVKDELDQIFGGGPARAVLHGDVLLDSSFSRKAMVDKLQQGLPVVHVATHFMFSPGDESRSFLLLGDGTPFTLAEMKKQRSLFKGVELLTLSACQTAAQRPNSSGREIDGFAELAQRLGARSVMASLWEVSDNSTSALMAEFYRNYLTGMNKADALRAAQLSLLTGGYRAADDPSRQLTLEQEPPPATAPQATRPKKFTRSAKAPYAHPFYWAPFILIGNWN